MMTHKSAMGEAPFRESDFFSSEAGSGFGRGSQGFEDEDQENEDDIMRRVMEESLKMHEQEEQKRS